MGIRHLDQLMAALLALFGGWLVWSGAGYGIMQGTTPGPGLFPVIMGAVILVLSVVNLARSILGLEFVNDGMTLREGVKAGAVMLAMGLFVPAVPLVGLTPAVIVLMVVTGLILRPRPDARSLAWLGVASVLVPAVCHLLFGRLLGVPIPEGPLGF